MKKLLLVFSFLLLLLSCKKDPPIPFCEEFPDECVDVRTVKEYFYFKVGSYWIYEEENTGLIDSVFVTETSSDYESVIFSTRLFSTYDGYFYRFWATGVRPEVENNMAKKSEPSTRVIRNKGKPGDYVAEETCFLFCPKVGLETTTSYISGAGIENYHVGVLKIESIHDIYNLDGNDYENVVAISEEYTSIEEGQPTNHFYSPNIGLIRKELIDSNQVWNLVDYRIFQ